MVTLSTILGDITTIKCDAIVNAANTTLLGGGGVDGAIHRAAGPKLLEECKMLHGCETGKAKITKAYNLPTQYVIHTPGPIWNGGNRHEAELLESSYRNCLELSEAYGCYHIAFPSISTGVYSFPLEQASEIAVRTIFEYCSENKAQFNVIMVCFNENVKKQYDEAIERYITK